MWNRVEEIRQAYRCGNSGCACRSGSNVHCPLHDDAKPSFGVDSHPTKPGHVLVVCRGGCDQDAVVRKLHDDGYALSDEPNDNVLPFVKPVSKKRPADEELVKTYLYTDANGRKLYEKGRFEWGARNDKGKREKRFAWRRYGQQGWAGLDGTKMEDVPLYRAQTVKRWVAEGLTVYFVEGEAAADALIDHGVRATCGPWGAHQKDFGEQLELLRDAHVVLWPDNDEAGRNYMHKIAVALKGVAAKISYCTPPMPEKGDAADYFAAGGVAADLDKDIPPTEPVVDRIGPDHIMVRYPSTLGVIVFDIADMEKDRRSIDCEMEIRIPNTNEAFSQRINLLSNSARTELRRDLDSITSTKGFWERVLLDVFGRARDAFLSYDRSVKISEIEDVEQLGFLIDTLVPDNSHSVIFADGSSGKTFMTYLMAVCVAAGVPCLGFEVKKRPVLIVDYETSDKTAKFRINRICMGLRELGHKIFPHELDIYYWHARGIPLHDQADALRRKVAQDNIGFVIVDSAAAACGGEPEDAKTALHYFTSGLDKLGQNVTTVTIAHIAKGADTNRPFGSAFWHNQPRRTWYIDRNQMAESDQMVVTMHCRKVNEGRLPSAVGVTIEFSGAQGPVRFTRSTAIYSTASSTADLVGMVYRALSTPMTIKELSEAVSANESTIRKVLQAPANKTRFKPAQEGAQGRGKATYWERIEQSDAQPSNVTPMYDEPDYSSDFGNDEEDDRQAAVPF